ncbi:conserved hypothetical protein [Culex quinquefasciatus]|uniref:F-box domain-containing protein n=1 Tax=Culex quinquefasciatus TaxID=7176 RepID=B0W1E9_CULQU|nr:conserved hypothetical protein [Culex quinquefasciatus]|eukprot:XP_001842533.1 conserved hypothetical protein [Culex quinquefasciatus]
MRSIVHVIELILEFLPLRERLATAAVCKQWYDLVFGTKFCRQRLVLRVEPGNNLVQLQQNNSLLLERCRAMHLQLNGIDDEGIVLLKDLLMANATMLRLSVVGSTRELKSILEDTLPGLDQLIGLEIQIRVEQSPEPEEVTSGELGEFLTKSSIAHINNLPTLKILQLVRMSLDSADWSQCRHRNQLQKIRLVGCPIDGRGAQQLAATFPELRELFLDHCHLRQPTDAFEIAENFSEQQALRRRLERCRVSYYDCHVEDSLGSC